MTKHIKTVVSAVLMTVSQSVLFAEGGLLDPNPLSKPTWVIDDTWVDEHATNYHRKLRGDNIVCYSSPVPIDHVSVEDLEFMLSRLGQKLGNGVTPLKRLAMRAHSLKDKMAYEIRIGTERIHKDYLQKLGGEGMFMTEMISISRYPPLCLTKEEIIRQYERHEILSNGTLTLAKKTMVKEREASLKNHDRALAVIKSGIRMGDNEKDFGFKIRVLNQIYGPQRAREILRRGFEESGDIKSGVGGMRF